MASPGRLLAALIAGLLLAAGCGPLRPARTPMPTVALAAPEDAGRRLFVLLPGLLDRPETFRKEGFGDLIGAAFPDARVVAADAHLGYYRQRSLLERLDSDVLEPLRADEAETWLVGVSLGGMGVLLTADEMPDRVDGLILMAPYLGDTKELRKVDAARQEGEEAVAGLKPRLRAVAKIWQWLESPERDRVRVILAYGESDRLADSADRLAGLLPPDDVITLPGGHDWKTWRALMERALVRAHEPPTP